MKELSMKCRSKNKCRQRKTIKNLVIGKGKVRNTHNCQTYMRGVMSGS